MGTRFLYTQKFQELNTGTIDDIWHVMEVRLSEMENRLQRLVTAMFWEHRQVMQAAVEAIKNNDHMDGMAGDR
jgi:hypothetical protein